jgi:hypothetical protein
MSRHASGIVRSAIALLVLSALVVALFVSLAVPVLAQLFGVVFDPTNYANALLRYAELERQFTELVQTYEQIRTQYELLQYQSQRLPVDLNGRYRSLPTPWLPLSAANTYGTTGTWIAATRPLLDYGPAMTALPAEEAARVQARYDRVELADASISHGLEALGFLRGHQMSVEQTIRNLEDDAYSGDPDFNTQIAVLNKLSASAVTSARLAKDANNVLVSLLEQQLLDATDRREAAVQQINAHIAFETDARPLLAQTTAQTTEALTTFRIP